MINVCKNWRSIQKVILSESVFSMHDFYIFSFFFSVTNIIWILKHTANMKQILVARIYTTETDSLTKHTNI